MTDLFMKLIEGILERQTSNVKIKVDTFVGLALHLYFDTVYVYIVSSSASERNHVSIKTRTDFQKDVRDVDHLKIDYSQNVSCQVLCDVLSYIETNGHHLSKNVIDVKAMISLIHRIEEQRGEAMPKVRPTRG